MNTEAIRAKFEISCPVPEYLVYVAVENRYLINIASGADCYSHGDFRDQYNEKWAGYMQAVKDMEVTGSTSDGYHTFDELYEFRKMYNAALFNEWAFQCKFNVHKSKKT